MTDIQTMDKVIIIGAPLLKREKNLNLNTASHFPGWKKYLKKTIIEKTMKTKMYHSFILYWFRVSDVCTGSVQLYGSCKIMQRPVQQLQTTTRRVWRKHLSFKKISFSNFPFPLKYVFFLHIGDDLKLLSITNNTKLVFEQLWNVSKYVWLKGYSLKTLKGDNTF